MHETSLVAELIDECERRAEGRPVSVVRVRHLSSIDPASLQTIFRALAEGSDLSKATLETESVAVTITCPDCGFSGVLDPDSCYGHIRVCPVCGLLSDDAQDAEIELVDVVVAVTPSS